jgi:hypothetical protein
MLADVPPMATLPVPPEVDPSNEPRTPPANPAERADARPRNPGEQNFWQRFLAANALTSGVREANLLAGENPWTPTTMPLPDRGRDGEPAPYMPPENYPQQTSGDLPLPPDVPPGEATPDAPGNAALAAAQRTRYPTLNVNDPNYQRTIDAYMESRPQQRERPQEEQMMRLIASALAGAGPGEYGPLGAVTGLAGGYARESDRDEALYQQDQRQRMDFQRGLAGLLGQTDQQQFQNQMARQTFDRQSQVLSDERDARNATLSLQTQDSILRRQLMQMRIGALARQAGVDSEPAAILAQGIPAVIETAAPLMITDAQGRTVPLTFTVGGQNLTLAQVRDRLMQQRGQAQNARNNPLFAMNPQMAVQQMQADMTDLLMQRFMTLTPQQQQQVLRQIVPLVETRRRAGTTRIGGDALE